MDLEKNIFDELQDLFGDAFELTEGSSEQEMICDIPGALKPFYTRYLKAGMPLGSIYTIENAKEISGHQPFCDEGWFCFGQDNYGFSFWLCKEIDGSTFFTAWDHDLDESIDEGGEMTLEEFLQDIFRNFEENETCSVEIKSCEDNSLAELMKIKKAFNMPEPISALPEIKDKLPYEISDDFPYVKALNILKELKLEKVGIGVFHVD